jgi:hypothetical protein
VQGHDQTAALRLPALGDGRNVVFDLGRAHVESPGCALEAGLAPTDRAGQGGGLQR